MSNGTAVTRRCALGTLALLGIGATTTGATRRRGRDAVGVQAEVDVEIEYAEEEPPLDGEPTGPWEDVAEYEMENLVRGETKPDPEAFSARWRGLWDETALYVFVEVTDDEIVVEPDDGNAKFHDDFVEIFLDGDHSGGSEYDGVHDAEYGFRPDDEDVWTGDQSIENTEGIEFSIPETETGYRTAIAIPWETLSVEASTGKLLGLDVHANNDDDGGEREHKLAWYDTTDDTWNDPSRMATAELVGGDDSDGSDDDNDEDPDDSGADDTTSNGSSDDEDPDESGGDDGDDIPGFGLGAAVVATLGAGLARARRSSE